MSTPITRETSADGRRIYRPDGLQLARFLVDRSPIAVIRGPWGSGKTLACAQRLWQHAVEQNHDSQGRRRSRWWVIRDSYPKIETTTMETWLEWFPEKTYGKMFTGTKPFRHEVRVRDIELDVLFMAVDELTGEAAFQSGEPTGVWWNELEYASMDLFFSAHARVGRYPPLIEGGSSWSGTIADMNAPPSNHWLPQITGEVELPDDMPLDERLAYERPPEMAYFIQPPAVFDVKGADGRISGFKVNPAAENLRYVGEGYYDKAMRGKSVRWIQSRLANKILPLVEGDAVYTNFDAEVHVAKANLEPVPGMAVTVGLDFGRRPAATFGQKIGRVRQVQFEAYMEKAGANRFAPEVRKVLARYYPWVLEGGGEVRFYGDPKGQDGTQTDETTAYDVFRGHGMPVTPAPVRQNNIKTRIEVIEVALDERKLLISPRCRRLIAAFEGGYRYPRERLAPLTEPKPIKDRYSDIIDAEQYAELGDGGGREMIGQTSTARPVRIVRAAHHRFAGARRPF